MRGHQERSEARSSCLKLRGRQVMDGVWSKMKIVLTIKKVQHAERHGAKREAI